MKTPDFKKLKKLADFLVSGKLGTDKFDFSNWYDKEENVNKNVCKTSGCAIGQCPTVFKKDWKLDLDNTYNPIRLIKGSSGSVFADAADFFKISEDDSEMLFSPDHGSEIMGKLVGNLSEKASARTVGNNIIKYINLKKQEVELFNKTKALAKTSKMNMYDFISWLEEKGGE